MLKHKGFTLVELLVTISIFAILTGIVLFNQTRFNSTILLTNLAYDTALTIRQAQTYGINIKNFNNGSFLPYGVHFDLLAPKSFILFADLSYNNAEDSGTGRYTSDNLTSCQVSVGCVSRYNITKGNMISRLCANKTGSGEDTCADVEKIDINFIRPNPDAHISATMTNGTVVSDNTYAVIELAGVDGSLRRVKVQSNGLIEIKH